MLIYFCDNFLQWYEIQMFGLVFERLFQAQNQMISSTEYQTKLTKLQVNLTEHPFTDRSALYRIPLELVKNRKLHNEMLFF